MLNAAKTLPADDVVTSQLNGPRLHALAPTRPPAPPSWKGLPPGPRIPAAPAYMLRRAGYFERCRQRYGSPFTIRMRIPSVPFVMIFEPDQLKQMFLAPPDVLWAGDGSSELHKYFGSPGLAYLEEDAHLVRRKVINRSAHGEAMKQISESVSVVVDEELSSWPRNELVELFPRFHRLAIHVVRYVNFGPRPDPRLDELVNVMGRILLSANRMISMLEDQYLPERALRAVAALRPTGYRQLLEDRARAHAIIDQIIEERRREGPGDAHDTLAVMLTATNEDGSPVETREIRNELMTNFIAGSATTATSMAWAIERLTREHAVRERLLDEIDRGEEDAYLTATVQEILRRKPPLPQVIPRLVVKDWELAGYTLPPGVRAVANPYLVHHNPEIYPQPYAFRPERFLDESPGVFTWIPFGGGRRRCLGKAIAELEIKTAVREIFTRFHVRPDKPEPEEDRAFMVITRPSRGARVTLTERS
jgi:hypothetical protein